VIDPRSPPRPKQRHVTIADIDDPRAAGLGRAFGDRGPLASIADHAHRSADRDRGPGQVHIPPPQGQGREREAAQREADARANFGAAANTEEAARRTGADAATRTEALVKMNAAASVLQGDQGALQGAAAVRQQAADALTAARARLAALEAELVAAQHAVDNPGRPPRSAVTLTMDLPRQVLSGDLTEAEQAVVRSLGEALASYSGAAADIAERAADAARREQEDRERKRAVFLQPLGGGTWGAAANPATAGRPLP
jgi:hypothetical protein